MPPIGALKCVGPPTLDSIDSSAMRTDEAILGKKLISI